jgi:polyphosphate kinase 2 (PPK2 family)
VLSEGWDASGKGGAIRRLTSALDPRHVRIAQFAAPSEDEKRHHFLHRFTPALPGWGGMSVLDRSWYGRVLVERVEGFATEPEWCRAYKQIIEYERSLASEGLVLVKLWLHVSEKEQRRRFRAREKNPLKRWKLTDEDWRNLSRRADYESALEETSPRPITRRRGGMWFPAESKSYARVRVIEIVIERVEAALLAAGQEPVDAAASL